jgi:hypothetical protein
LEYIDKTSYFELKEQLDLLGKKLWKFYENLR